MSKPKRGHVLPDTLSMSAIGQAVTVHSSGGPGEAELTNTRAKATLRAPLGTRFGAGCFDRSLGTQIRLEVEPGTWVQTTLIGCRTIERGYAVELEIEWRPLAPYDTDPSRPAPIIFRHNADGTLDILCQPCGEVVLVEGFDDSPAHRQVVKDHEAGHAGERRAGIVTEASLVLLPGCPNPYRVPDGRRFFPEYAILCGCPGEGVYRPRHWVYLGVPFFCACAPHEDPAALGPGGWYTGNDAGYACQSCVRLLPGYAILRHLVQDMACCWCGGNAHEGSGYRICGHPARKDVTT